MTEEEKKATNNLYYSVTDVMFNALYSQEQMKEDIKTALNLIQRQQEENEKKDKIIDEMANSFAEEGFYSEHCQTLIDNNICTDDCNKCVKQYFERKVKK